MTTEKTQQNVEKDEPVDRYQAVVDALRAEHGAAVSSSAMQWSWSCSCGKSGQPTTYGRATSGRDRHLRAERSRLHTRIFSPEERS